MRRAGKGWAGIGALLGGALVILALALAPRAEAYVYWGDHGEGAGSTVGRANLDGTGTDQSFIAGASGPCGVAVNAAHVFWANRVTGAIGRANLDGTGVNHSFITGANLPCGVAVDAGHVYWANTNGTTIGRANLDGTGVDPSFIAGAGGPCGVAVDSAHVYWANRSAGSGTTLGRANLNGTGVDSSFIGGATEPCGVAVDSSRIYWANLGANAIGRANLNGTGADHTFIPANVPCGVAANATHIYWANRSTETIGRANLDGTGADQSLTNTTTVPCGVAVDALPVPPPVVGETVNVRTLSGVISVKCEGDTEFRPIQGEEQIPVGCLVDTRKGHILLTSSRGTVGGTQSSEFWAGIFRVKQKVGFKPFTELKLAGSLECGKGRGSAAERVGVTAAAKRAGRKLWGKGKGKFKSKGKRGAGSVRGTKWQVADLCGGGTLCKVKNGNVRFRDFVRNKTVTVRSGEQYVAKR